MFVALSTRPLTSVFPSLVFVCPSNCGSPSFTEMTAASPSRMSSPVRFSSFSLRMPFCRAYALTVLESADRKPERCAPPSWVFMLLAKVKTESWKPLFHCSATSTAPASSSRSR